MKIKGFCDLVCHSSIESERLKEIERTVAAAAAVTERHHAGCPDRPRIDFFVEVVRNFREGQPVNAFGVCVPREDAAAMVAAKDCEGELLAGFSRMITGLTNKLSKKFGVSEEDLFGESYKAFLNAMIHYNGKTRFSTFLQICVRRQIVRSCQQGQMIRVPAEIRRLTMRVVDRMNGDGVSFDDAIGAEGVSREKATSVVAAMAKVSRASDLEINESEMASSNDRRLVSGVMDAVSRVNLGPLEKAVLNGFLDSPTGSLGLSKGCRGMVNPETGRPYSRAAISSAWKQARKKLAVVLKEVA